MKNTNFEESQINLVKKEFSRATAYASEYEDKTPISHFFNARIRRVAELLSDFEKGKVLDIGCGPSRIGQIFRGKTIEYYGVDVSDKMIKTAIEVFGNNAQFHFALGNIENLAFPEDSFDVVLCLGILEYVLDGNAAIREVQRVLKPNGVLIATMLNEWSPYRLWQTYGYWKFCSGARKLGRLMKTTKNGLKGVKPTELTKPQSVRYTEKTFRQLLTSAGLEIEDVMYYDFNLIPAPVDAKIPSISVFLSSNLEWLCRGKLRFLGTGLIAKGRKEFTSRLDH